MIKKILLFSILFFANIAMVGATPINDECINNNTCLTLCNYKTTLVKKQGQISRNITIYYNYNAKNISIKWEDQDTGTTSSYIYDKTGAIDYVFSNAGSNIYWGIEGAPSLSNFVCPKNGYLDTSDLNGGNELCFDNNGTTCKTKYSDVGTAFSKQGGFVSQEKDYDFESEIEKYASWIFGDITEDISNGKFNVESELTKKIEKDFKTNCLNNNDLPEFIKNSEIYINLQDSIEEEFNKAKNKAIEESEQEVQNGEKTEEEHQETINNWDVDINTVKQQAENAFANIETNITWLSDFNVSDYCSSYLGNPEIKGQPAYYLQFIFNLIKYASIILLLVLTIGEFAKATASSNQDAFKKALQVSIKRIIIVIIIFFLPILIKFLFTILGAYSPGTCGIS